MTQIYFAFRSANFPEVHSRNSFRPITVLRTINMGSQTIGRHHQSRTDGGARPRVGQLDYDLSSTYLALYTSVYKGAIVLISEF